MKASEPVSDQVFHILLSLLDGPRHGYGIIQAVEARTGGAFIIGSGTLYSAIKRMESDGWLERVDGPDGEDPRRKYYGLTAAGREGDGRGSTQAHGVGRVRPGAPSGESVLMHRALVALHGFLARLLLPPAFRAEFAEELAISVEARVESARRSKRSVVALLELLDLVRTAAREWRRVLISAASRAWDGASIDVRIAIRSLAKDRKTTAIAISTIAIAIGASSAVLSVLEGVLLRPLDCPAADRIVRPSRTFPASGIS